MNAVAICGLAVALPILLVGPVSIHLFVTTSRLAPLAVEPAPVTDCLDSPLAPQDIVLDSRGRQAPRAGRGGTIDLYGNEVTDAMAEYTLDPAGSLYELHSPQTELPRLGIPQS